MSSILILGATRGTGFEAAKLLHSRGVSVAALVRSGSDAGELEALGVRVIRGDVLNAADLDAALATDAFTAIVNTVGGKRGEQPRPDVEGTRNMIDAATRAGIRRLLLVTAIGAGDSRGAVAPKVLEVLGEVLALKTEAENLLIDSGLDYTILRPGGMTFDPPSGTAIRTEDHSVMGVITRADLAALTVDCIDDASTFGRIYHTVDPEITWQAPLQRGEELGTKK